MRDFIIILSILIIGILIINEDNSMNKCQETHSFDTCFSNLNR